MLVMGAHGHSTLRKILRGVTRLELANLDMPVPISH